MLEIKNLSIEVGLRPLLKDLNLNLEKNDKVAIIGEEGNGKSTLLKAIYGALPYGKVTGTIRTLGNQLGYLKQFLTEEEERLAPLQYLFSSTEDYYHSINLLYMHIKRLRMDPSLLERPQMSVLSGGEKVKMELLKILLEEPDILLLDEPTNDLDIETLRWLEQFIITCEKPILFVSHDEMLLSKTANAILHLEQINKKTVPRHTFSKIGYEMYIEKRRNGLDKQQQVAVKERHQLEEKQKKLAQIRDKVDHQLNTITRADPHGAKMLKRKMQTIKVQERRMDLQELTEIPDYEEAISLFFPPVSFPNQKEVLKLDLETLSIGKTFLSKDIHLYIRGKVAIGIVGHNGSGKTTLLHQIYELLKDRKDLVVGYMPQNYEEVLATYDTPLSFLGNGKDKEELTRIRTIMGNLKFTREEMVGDLSQLSGGSKAKLILLKLILEECNVLLLDEPTRNVSPLSNPIIREALSDYQGVIISISHDRMYLKEVCNVIYRLDETGLHLENKEEIVQ